MTLSEFKAWFEGFTEDMDARPTEKQWKRIKARVKEIDGTAITREVYYRNWPYWGPYYYAASPYSASGASVSSRAAALNVGIGANTASANGSNALFDAGKAEYQEVLNG